MIFYRCWSLKTVENQTIARPVGDVCKSYLEAKLYISLLPNDDHKSYIIQVYEIDED